MSGVTIPVLLPLPDLPAASTPLGANDLLLIEQGGLAKKIAASAVLPGGTISANLIYAGPASGGAAIPQFRALVAGDIPATLNSTTIAGTLNASAVTVGGNSVLQFAQQGTVTVYGSLVIGSNLTLDAGGTLTATGGGAGSGTVDVGTSNHLAYYAATAASVGGAPYVAVGGGVAAGFLILGQASTRSGGVIMSDLVGAATGTLTVFSNILAMLGGDGAGTVDGASVAITAGNAASTGNGGDILLTMGATAGGSRAGQLCIVNVPTADSAVANSVWWDTGVLVRTGFTLPTAGTIVAGGVLAGGTFVGSGTISLSLGAGLTDAGGGTIANAGVLSFDSATGAILIGAGLQRASQTISVKPATTAALGGIIAGNGVTVDGSGTMTVGAGITALIAGAGITTSIASTNGTITSTGTLTLLETPVAQTGTTYAFGASDRSNLITFSNTASIAATIAQAGVVFPSGFYTDALNLGAGLLTLTPTTSTINGKTTLVLQQHQGARVISDGANYFAMISSPIYIAAGNAMVARSAGNARGSNSVDLQPTNSSMTAAQVASGTNSVALGGTNTASGTRSVAIGTGNTASGADNSVAIGYNNTAGTLTFSGPVAVGISNSVSGDNAGAFGYSNAVFGAAAFAVGYDNDAGNSVGGTFSAAFGYQNSTLGINSVGLGYRSRDRGNKAGLFFSGFSLDSTGASDAGRTQIETYVLVNKTSGSTAVRLTADNAAAGATNVAALGTSSTQMFDCWVTITDTTNGEYVTYYMAVPAAISKGANNASTALGTPGPVFTLGDVSGSPPTLAAAPTITADTTNGGYNLSYTPPVANSNTLYAVGTIRILNTRFS